MKGGEKVIFIEEQKYKKEIGIYKIRNIVNGNVYIGQTRNCFQERYWYHNRSLKSKKHFNKNLQNDWNKYGENNFCFEVIEVLPVDKLNDREIFWILEYKKQNLCYCVKKGGSSNKNISEETRKKMSKTRTGKYIKKTTDVLTLEQAKEIKQRLMKEEKPSYIAKTMNVSYKVVNNILSNDAFKNTVYVEGWEEFQKNRNRRKCVTQEEIERIYRLYDEIGTYCGVARIIGKDKEFVKYHILKRNK